MEETSAEDPTQDDEEENKTEEQKSYEAYGKVLLTCGKCIAEVECDKNYFGTNFYLAPYPTDKSYIFICSACEEKPYLKHLEKSWTDIALCALTTLEMMGGWALFSSTDIESFVDSNFEELAVNKDQENSAENNWPDLLRHELDNCKYIQRHELGGQIMYSLSHLGVAPLTEAHFVPEKALAVSKNSKGEAMYKIKWEGFDEKYATWEPITNLSHVDKIIPKGLKQTPFIKEEETGDNDDSVNRSTEEYLSDKEDEAEGSQTVIIPIKRKASDSPEREGGDKKCSPPRPAVASSEKESGKKSRGKKPVEVNIVPTTHHTFKVACTKCSASVPVTELTDTMIEPSFTNYSLLCSTCTNGAPIVTFAGTPSVREVMRRTLFMLHVHNPNQGFFTTTEMANLFLGKPALGVNSDLHSVPETHLRRLFGSRISQDTFIRPLYLGSGRYQYTYSPDINYTQPITSPSLSAPKPRRSRSKPQPLSLSSSVPPPSPLPPPSAHEAIEHISHAPPSSHPAISPPVTSPPPVFESLPSVPPSSDPSTPHASSSTHPPPPPIPSSTPPPSHVVSYPPHPYYPYALPQYPYPYPLPYPYPPYASPFYPAQDPSYPPPPSTPPPPTHAPPTPAAENQKQDSQSTSGTLPDVFVKWLGEEEVLGFLRVSLESSLSDLRQDIKNNAIVEEEEKYIFLYKSAPVKPQQESRIFLRECATKTDDGYLLTVKRNPS